GQVRAHTGVGKISAYIGGNRYGDLPQALITELGDQPTDLRSQVFGGHIQGRAVVHLPIKAMATGHMDGDVLIVQGKWFYLYRPIVKAQGGLQAVQIDGLAVEKVKLVVQGGDQWGLTGIHGRGEQLGQQIPRDGPQIWREITLQQAGNIDIRIQLA